MQQDINLIHNDRALIIAGGTGVSGGTVGGASAIASMKAVPKAMGRTIYDSVGYGAIAVAVIAAAVLAYKFCWN